MVFVAVWNEFVEKSLQLYCAQPAAVRCVLSDASPTRLERHDMAASARMLMAAGLLYRALILLSRCVHSSVPPPFSPRPDSLRAEVSLERQRDRASRDGRSSGDPVPHAAEQRDEADGGVESHHAQAHHHQEPAAGEHTRRDRSEGGHARRPMRDSPARRQTPNDYSSTVAHTTCAPMQPCLLSLVQRRRLVSSARRRRPAASGKSKC